MFKRFFTITFVALILATLGGCAAPMGQGQYGNQSYRQPPVVDQFPEVHPSGNGVLCTVEVTRNGNTSRATISVGSPRDCNKVGGFVQQGTNGATNQGGADIKQGMKLEETVIPSASERSNCRLRQNGKVLAEVQIPASVPKGEASKKFCDSWQRKEAADRGLI